MLKSARDNVDELEAGVKPNAGIGFNLTDPLPSPVTDLVNEDLFALFAGLAIRTLLAEPTLLVLPSV